MKQFSVNPIVNIVRAELVTEEENPRVMWFETLSSATPEPFISEGAEKELRIKNRILAQDTLEDIIKGYNIKLKDCALSRELLEIVDGGNSADAAAGRFAGYTSPAAGETSGRVRFTLRLYAAEKDYGGEAVAYFRFTFPGCVGTPAKFSFEDGVFVTPEYTVRSRPGSGMSALTVECIDSVPLYCSGTAELPASPQEGTCIVATGAVTAGTVTLKPGEMAYYNGSGYEKII